MFNPIAAFNTILAAVAAFVYGVIVTAVGAKFAKTANFKTVVKKTSVTLRTYYTAINAVVAAVFARFTKRITVAALYAVHILFFYTILAPSAIGANKRTGRAFPAIRAKGIPVIGIAFFAFGAVQTVAVETILAKLTLIACKNIAVQETRAAPSAMVIIMARSVRAIVTATSAPFANIIIVMPMPAAGALDTVFPTGKSRHGKNRAQQDRAQQNT